VISQTVLVAPEPFADDLDGELVAAAIGRGIQTTRRAGRGIGPALAVDLCPIESGEHELLAIRRYLDAVDFDARMRAARAVVVGAGRLDEATLLGSATFEIATRARQSGVPAYAVTGCNALSLFDTRVLDLQVVLETQHARGLQRAGQRLAGLI
jgi:glycerate kinase